VRKLRIVVPKGSIYQSVTKLLTDAGIRLQKDDRAYRPLVSDPELEVKIMRPQNIPELIELGSHDAGFTGFDWVAESKADVLEVLDLGFDPVSIVAAIPKDSDQRDLRSRRIIVASEYENVSKGFLDREGYSYVFLRTYGATEVFPPDDADMIIDNMSTGRTLTEHNLQVIATLLTSSTRFVANRGSYDDPGIREKLDELKTLFRAVIDARSRVMLEMNIPKKRFNEIISGLPCMRAPTVSPLHGDQGFAVKIAVPRAEVSKLVPRLKKLGATDIVEYELRKVVA